MTQIGCSDKNNVGMWQMRKKKQGNGKEKTPEVTRREVECRREARIQAQIDGRGQRKTHLKKSH